MVTVCFGAVVVDLGIDNVVVEVLGGVTLARRPESVDRNRVRSNGWARGPLAVFNTADEKTGRIGFDCVELFVVVCCRRRWSIY